MTGLGGATTVTVVVISGLQYAPFGSEAVTVYVPAAGNWTAKKLPVVVPEAGVVTLQSSPVPLVAKVRVLPTQACVGLAVNLSLGRTSTGRWPSPEQSGASCSLSPSRKGLS